MVRLDKYLADMGKGTRTEVKKYIRSGRVRVDGEVALRPDAKISSDQIVSLDDQQIIYEQYQYYLMHKPAGVISASEDKRQQTVVDLISERGRREFFPVGRLDKDTTGLLLITDDGPLAHKLLSPRHHVIKTYQAEVDGLLTEDDIKCFQEGIQITQEWTTLPAKLVILHAGRHSLAQVSIYEGKFHQIKRMFEAVGKPVLSLCRIAMGPLSLPAELLPGQYRTLTDEEYNALMKLKE